MSCDLIVLKILKPVSCHLHKEGVPSQIFSYALNTYVSTAKTSYTAHFVQKEVCTLMHDINNKRTFKIHQIYNYT